MEVIEGGGQVADCVGFAAGVIGLAAGIALIPATGGLSWWVYAGMWSGAVGTGISMAGCFNP